MQQAETIIKNQSGLHIRPATKITKLVHEYPNCQIEIIYNNRKINAKSLLSILTLGVPQGAKIILKTHGQHEELILQRLLSLFDSEFFIEI